MQCMKLGGHIWNIAFYFHWNNSIERELDVSQALVCRFACTDIKVEIPLFQVMTLA